MEIKFNPKNFKYVLEFETLPAFIYVCEDAGKEHIFKDGDKVKFWRSLQVNSSIDDVPTHDIGYVTVRDKEKDND
jgi:hypothetical protein